MALRIKNWESFQHYKTGRGAPPWIKLYRGLLNDKEWFSLDPVSAKLLVSVWVLVAETDGFLPDSDTLAFRLRTDSKTIAKFISDCSHWIISDDSDLLANCYQVATPETETDISNTNVLLVSSKLPPCPHQEIIEVFGNTLPELPQPRVWEGQRQKDLSSRWKWALTAKKRDGSNYATDKETGIDFFNRLFRHVAKSDFLMGRKSDWSCDLGWIVKASNFEKIISGNYDNREVANG